ncbi:MAG: type II toxin-antitoxin system Phd/YefM family antitoxin [Candidatus Dojkabacteria bacterium]|jgi:antitoxin YefM
MTTINITQARKDLFSLVEETNNTFNPIKIVNNRGGSAVLISEQDWRDIQETIYLTSLPKFVKDVKSMRKKGNWKEYKEEEEW